MLRRDFAPYNRLSDTAFQEFENLGAPGTIRTSDPQIRSVMLHPT
jgi:hypothetical protein